MRLVSIFLVVSLGFASGSNDGTDSKSNPQAEKSSYAEDDSDMYMEPLEPQEEASNLEQQEEVQQESENSFFPSFSDFRSQPLGHSRPFFTFNHQQEGAYSQRSQPPFQQIFDTPIRFNAFKEDYPAPSAAPSAQSSSAAPETHGLLGSGNFGVIRGGTFFNDNDGEHSSYGDYNSFFHNGHGRPSFYFGGPPNPKPQKHEQFANFRDFADINTPSDRQYSHYVIVYVNKNDTDQQKASIEAPEKIQKPKNIIERLAMLDLEMPSTTEAVPEKKLSKSKRKLALLLPEKKYKIKIIKKQMAQKMKEFNEPMLALS